MSKKLKISAALLVVLSIGNTAIAKGFNSMKIINPPTFEHLDINNDGKLSRKEMEKQRDFMVQSMDLNGDKMVSAQELIKRHAKRADFFAKQILNKLDSNGDGSLSFTELKSSQQWKLERMFYRLDKNNDGFISKKEAETAKKNMLKR